jgi:O-antigen/teichoic acid export membrane protein
MRKSNLLNLAALSGIQAANAITPLILFPYVFVTVGPDSYALLATAEAAAVAITVMVVYSFEIDGPAKIARISWSANHQATSEIFSQIFYARLLIFVAASIVSMLVAWVVLDERSVGMFALWLGVPLSFALQPSWLFQAIEKNTRFAAIVVVSRVASLIIVVTEVSDAEDVVLVPVAVSICYFLGAIASLVYLHAVFSIRLRLVQLKSIWSLLVEGRHIFFGNFSVALYRDLNVLILGMVGASPSAVAAYSMAEKLVKGLQTIIRPLNQLYFPKALRLLAEHSRPDVRSLSLLCKLLLPQIAALALLAVCAVLFWALVIPEVFRTESLSHQREVAFAFGVMVPAVFFGVANFMLGTTGLNFLGQKEYMMRSIIATGGFSVVVCAFLSVAVGSIGASLSFVMAEVVLFVFVIRKYLHRCSRL